MADHSSRSTKQVYDEVVSSDSEETPLDTAAVVQQLTDELRATKEQLQATVEEYETSNEELRSTTEELQSTNEELVTVNQEYKTKIEELAQANSDLQNLMAATEIGTIFLSRDLCIKRFTPSIEQFFNITSTDIDRPLAHFTNRLGYSTLLDDARQVLERLVPVEREMRSEAGRWCLVRLRPYRNVEDKIDEVVITFVDISGQKQTQQALEEARVYADNIVNTVREPLVVLDLDLRVISANQSFYDTFEVHPEETEQRLIYELGKNQWDIPRLRELLEEILPRDNAFNDFEVTNTFEQVGRRTMLLNARRIDAKQLILLAIEDISRRKEAEQQATQQEGLAQLYLDVAGVMMVAIDRAGHVTMINRAGCKILEYAEDEIVGKDWFAHFLPERDRGPVRKVFETMLAGEVEAVEHYENAVLTRSGAERLILWHNAVVRDEQGAMIGTLGSGTDITARKQAEEGERQSEQRFRNLFEDSPDAIFVEDLDGYVLDVNRAACHLHHTERATLIGLNVRDLVPPGQQEIALRDFDKLVRGEVSHLQAHSWTMSRHAIPVEIRANRFVYGGQDALLLHVRDISERVAAEAALQESRARAQAILSTTVDAVITIDEEGRIESVNPATEHIFGYATEELVGQNVRMLMPAPYHDEHDKYLRQYLETGNKKIIGLGRELTAQRKDGSIFPIDLAVSEVRFGERRIFTGFIRDISERRRLEQEVLRISEEERQRIGQDIHDGLASQFSGMALLSRGLVNRLKKGQPLSPEMLEELAQLARSGAEQARALARGLISVKLDQEGLQAALKELMHRAEILSGLSYTLDMDEALPPLATNVAPQLYRIAQEAVTNAVKHAGASTLSLRLRRDRDHLVLTVRDDGAGLLEEAKEAGGMGLHIMPYRARMVGATLRIDSAPGAGTCVTCSLPLSTATPDENT